ncbi:MAG: TonB-dependent receptor [Citrobacter freundii]|nr:MAG: TonB-dependent receptor [Citrobacter freundii]
MNKILILFAFLFMLAPQLSHAQTRVVTGVVRETSGPLEGASVSEKGVRGNTVVSDRNGKFSITLRGTSNALTVTMVNYQNQEVNVANTNQVDIQMAQIVGNMDEVIVVGFGKKKRITSTGAVSSVKADEIRYIPTSNVQNTLMGRLPGFFSQQRSGQPGKDASDYFIRGISSLNSAGNRPLIIVDDIEYTYEQLSQINVNEIDNISILKDASTTAIYGIKGANGVLVVTTRRGSGGAPKFNVRVEGGMQAPVRRPKFLDSYNTALLVNEAYNNDGLQPLFTDNDLQLFKDGTDPYGHPNVDWYSAINRPSSLQANANLDISGGTQAVKYFISGGAFTQNGNIRDFSLNTDGVNSNYFYRRFNLRSNLDVQATKSLSLRLDVTTRIGDINQPYGQNVISSLYNFAEVHPYSAPFLNPDGSYAYYRDTRSQRPTINAILQSAGYSRQRRTDLNVLFGFTEKLDAVTKGLSLIGRVAYAGVNQNTLNLFRDAFFPPSYYYDPVTKTYSLNTGVSRGGYTLAKYRTTGNTDLQNQRVNAQLYLNYERNFAKHHVSSLLLYNQQSYRVDYEASVFGTTVAQVPQKFRGYSLKLGYDFDQKYLIDFNAAYNGSDRFQENKRFGFFPAVGLGWNISKEDFFSKALPFFNLFKLRVSYGLVGSDVALGNQYLYNQQYYNGGGYSFGQNPGTIGTVYEGNLGNDNVGWEKAKKFDVGLDMNLFKDKISVTVDYFHDRRYDQLVTRQDVPLMLGIGLSPSNVAVTVNRGFDGMITYQDKIGQLQYSIGTVFSFAKNKVLYQAEASPSFPWLAKTGHPIDQPFGYTWVGYYSEKDITDQTVAKPIGQVFPGDLKYKDFNGDGIIDQNDMSAIGRPNLPNLTVGMPIKLGYKGFDVNIMFQGAFMYSLAMRGTAIEPFQSQFQPIHQLRWTADNTNPQFPRLTTNPTSINSPSSYLSDYWLINAHYIRLKTVEVSYQLPSRHLPFGINNTRVYLSGYNLLTWSNVTKKYQSDPEVAPNSAGDAYLMQRIINLGVMVGF